ncbi:hypothetical protein [Streptomyces sp. NPDC051079]|uniref:hypothetical protein n=1 Tax=Streptomyces sp. NPDC051079 TaxID=3155043 RepID=UPI00344CB4C0
MSVPVEERQLPVYRDLTHGQHMGWNCIWCNQRITVGGRAAGHVSTRHGAHHLSVPVYAGPCCSAKEKS